MTDTSNSNIFTQIEATLTADWQKVATVLNEAETFFGAFLTKVAAGAQIVITDIEQVGQYVAGHLTVINSSIAALGTLAGAVAPNNVTAQKVIDDLNTGAADVAALSNSLSSGSTSGDPALVTTAVTAIGAVKQLAQIASNAGATLTTLAANSATATTAVSPTSPAAGA